MRVELTSYSTAELKAAEHAVAETEKEFRWEMFQFTQYAQREDYLLREKREAVSQSIYSDFPEKIEAIQDAFNRYVEATDKLDEVLVRRREVEGY